MLGTSAWEAGGRLKWGGLGGRSPPREEGDDADDGDDGDDGGADAPTPNPPQLGPQAPCRKKYPAQGNPSL